ncbi:MAG TPA: ADP-ribosylation factor-directed GTPase activating protein isoform b, partial [Pirellulales bacterium]|nr:ADP-ribosylation factor-directed GTPase activating protein isoform b [Pirellulales bacterium]
WTAKDGTTWTIPRIVEMEAAQDLNSSACGGTHRMYGLAIALDRHRATGGSIEADSAWQKAQQKIQDAVDAAREFQQPDGSLSTNYFARAASSADIALRISTTGHALEFLTVALDDKQLQEPWVTRAAVHLLECFEKTEKFDLECGSLYHAAHGLKLYRQRRFGNPDAPPETSPAKSAAVDPDARQS